MLDHFCILTINKTTCGIIKNSILMKPHESQSLISSQVFVLPFYLIWSFFKIQLLQVILGFFESLTFFCHLAPITFNSHFKFRKTLISAPFHPRFVESNYFLALQGDQS